MTVTWVRGWAVSRGVPEPVAIDGGVRVDAGSRPGTRYVLHTATRESVTRIVEEIAGSPGEIKLLGTTEWLRRILPGEWTMLPRNDLMTAPLSRTPVDVPPPYTAEVIEDGRMLLAKVRDGAGTIAASARLARVGRCGIVDQVETEPEHRRRGLGTVAMRLLGNRAPDDGITTGLLAATADGRALYSRIGWTAHAEIAGAYRR